MADSTEIAPRRSRIPAPLRAMRPKQWVKNVLVFAAPVAAGYVLRPQVLVSSLLAFVAFCAISASVYLVNDVRDVESDRQHPTKRRRPIAAGELSPTTALVMAGVLLVIALAIAFSTATLLGRTALTLFDPARKEPALLRVGDKIRFVPQKEGVC